jgi:4-hydroxybenzoate polyprenyltransferase
MAINQDAIAPVICWRQGPPGSFQMRLPGMGAMSSSPVEKTWQRYLAIARPDHWIKNIFMIPGMAVALVVAPVTPLNLVFPLIIGTISLCLAASANYTINEHLDAAYDRFHPVKGNRPGARGLLDARIVTAQYLTLTAASIALSAIVNISFVLSIISLLIMGLIYNVPPIRTKDKVFLDILSESINNPIRFLSGWFIVAPAFFPPTSVLLAYWMGGAFLMAVKRYSEYRTIGDHRRAVMYRRSFELYSEQSLLLSLFFYAVCSAFFIGIFLIKYRVEFLLSTPLFAALFTLYLAIGMKRNSATQAPEKLYRETTLISLATVTFIASILLFFVDIPSLHAFMEPRIIDFKFGSY